MKTLKFPEDIVSISLTLSAGANDWLHGTTRLNDGSTISNRDLLDDLLARMTFKHTSSDGFRRNLELNRGEAQFSEHQLAEDWGLSRKKVRSLLAQMESVGLIRVISSRVASRLRFPFVESWRTITEQ